MKQWDDLSFKERLELLGDSPLAPLIEEVKKVTQENVIEKVIAYFDAWLDGRPLLGENWKDDFRKAMKK